MNDESQSLMTNKKMDQLIQKYGAEIEGSLGYWVFTFKSYQLVVITDEHHNRMRVMSAIASKETIATADLENMLAANFDRALDAKYALNGEYIYAVFTHPLKELTTEQFLDALLQVKNLAENYGTSYQSTDLQFNGGS